MANSKPALKKNTDAVSGPVMEKSAAAESISTTPALSPTASTSNSSHTLKIVLIVIAVLVALSVLGGLAATYMARTIVQKGIEGATGGKVKVDSSGTGAVTIKGKDGSTTFSTDTKLPDGFPTDAPVYKPSTLKLSTKSGSNYSATWSTPDAADKVTAYYKTQLVSQGWSSKEDSEVNFGTVSTASYTKDKRQLTMIVTGASGSATQTAISLTVSPLTTTPSN